MWHAPSTTWQQQLGSVVVRAQYVIEWEIQWLASNDPPSHTGSWMNFLHVGNTDSIRIPGLWLGSSTVNRFYISFDQNTYGSLNGNDQLLSVCCSGFAWQAGEEYLMRMTMLNGAGSGTTGCTGTVTVTPKATGVTYTASTTTANNCLLHNRGTSQAVYIGDPWYQLHQWSTRNVRIHYFE